MRAQWKVQQRRYTSGASGKQQPEDCAPGSEGTGSEFCELVVEVSSSSEARPNWGSSSSAARPNRAPPGTSARPNWAVLLDLFFSNAAFASRRLFLRFA